MSLKDITSRIQDRFNPIEVGKHILTPENSFVQEQQTAYFFPEGILDIRNSHLQTSGHPINQLYELDEFCRVNSASRNTTTALGFLAYAGAQNIVFSTNQITVFDKTTELHDEVIKKIAQRKASILHSLSGVVFVDRRKHPKA